MNEILGTRLVLSGAEKKAKALQKHELMSGRPATQKIILKLRPCGLPKPQKLYDNIIMVNKYPKPFCMSDTSVLVLITLMLFYSSPDFLFLVHIN